MGARALIADDSATMRKIILRSLEAVGVADATEVNNGDDAVAKYAAERFDLVVTDWNMPGMKGIDVVREIRKLDADVPVIMVTTEVDKSRVREAIDAGVSDYLVKPFTAEVLEEKLRKFLR